MFLMGLFFIVRRGQRRKGLIVLALFAIAMFYGLYAGLEYTINRFASFEQTMEARYLLVERTLPIFKDYPVAGIGMGNFRYASGRYQDPANKDFLIDYAHNDYAQFLAEAGIAGVVLLFGGIFWYLGRTFILWRRRKDPFALSLGMLPFGALFAMAIHSYSDFDLHLPANVMLLTTVLAIGNAALRLESHGRHSRMNHAFRLFSFRRQGAFLLAGAVVLIFWFGLATVRHFMGEAYVSTEINSTLNLEQNPSAGRARAAMSWDGGNAEYPFKLARALMTERDERMAPPNPDHEGWKKSHDPIIAALQRAISLMAS